MSRLLVPLLLVAAWGATAAPSAAAQAETWSETIRIPIETTFAAGGCLEEPVRFSGTLLLHHRATTDATGEQHLAFQTALQGVGGRGRVSGDRYVLVGAYTEVGGGGGAGAEEYTIVTVTRLVRQGEESERDDEGFFYLVHATITPDGEVVAHHEEIREECR